VCVCALCLLTCLFAKILAHAYVSSSTSLGDEVNHVILELATIDLNILLHFMPCLETYLKVCLSVCLCVCVCVLRVWSTTSWSSTMDLNIELHFMPCLKICVCVCVCVCLCIGCVCVASLFMFMGY
jgi:hypothetical protein